MGSTIIERNAIIVRSSIFWGNRAINGLGGVFFTEATGNLYLSGVLAWNNSAYSGGVVGGTDSDLVATQFDSEPAVRFAGHPMELPWQVKVPTNVAPSLEPRVPKRVLQLVK